MQLVRLMSLAAACAFIGTAALANSAAPAARVTTVSSGDDQQIICKKHLETGSLVRKAKRCFTKGEWERIAESEVRGTRRMVEELRTRPSGVGGN
ncbi:hypothetical protein ACFOMD_01910 [Sphingoaurantiacus capsulatus]|uniref:Secreted protein n=1 Tax=Sphingoaurantiacus capsulatus TaxID=1771310 RepID=A0ABV7X5U3_9SPHN